ncbi:MAG: hypothetical protein M8364_02665 [Methylobacter sp.]|uniref:hypothetical protein n=1 Tax=Methylobacter sp. TaxID=2051955 RepID=UPI0025831BD8|nr:hypothetical protein [Methylobacter sp.]MCL7419793.1 hypothetical protein [Methylobacter sp.]
MIAAAHPEDTTKPSRINRRRKKRWKKTGLTNYHQASMLNSLSQKTKARDWPPGTSGAAATIAVFLCAKLLSSSLLCRAEWALARVAGARTGRPTCSVRHHDWSHDVGFITLRDIIMKNNASTSPAKSSQSKYISLFNLIKRTPEGKRVICRNLTFCQASALLAEIPNAVIKFSRFSMEAAQ